MGLAAAAPLALVVLGASAPGLPIVGLLGVFAGAYSLHLFLAGLVALALAVAGARGGAREVGLTGAVLATVVVAGAAVVLAALVRTADRAAAPLSLSAHLAAPLDLRGSREPDTHRYATVDGWPLFVDVWRPAGAATSARPAVVYAHGGGFVAGARGLRSGWPSWVHGPRLRRL